MKLSAADSHAEKTVHTLKSSNLPFYAAVWEAAKARKALVTFSKRFYWEEKPTRSSKRTGQKRGALVEVVAEGGQEWVKVSTTSEQRLLFELAKARWEAGDSSDDEDGDPASAETRHEDEYDRMELVKIAADLQRASQANRVHYVYPRVCIELPKISESHSPELGTLFERIRAKGVSIKFMDPHVDSGKPADLDSNVFPRLLPAAHPSLTSTLNIDCTILLALVSDLSYTQNHPIQPNYNEAIRRQIELESHDHLLPLSLWPALVNKELVCTTEAATRMREIVNTLGTPSECARTDLVIEGGRAQSQGSSDHSPSHLSSDQLCKALQGYSDYEVPAAFRIPIRILDAPSMDDILSAVDEQRLPPVAKDIADDLSPINRSVFFYGWLNSCTTVTSNRSVARSIERTIERNAKGSMGPEIWLREPARSLVGKEKERRG